MEKDIALSVGLERRVRRGILGRGGSCRSGTQLEINACTERDDKAISWVCHVAEAGTARETGARLGAMLMG